MSTRDMQVEIDDSYKRNDGNRIGHNLILLAEIDRGSIRTTGDILLRNHQCGPLLIVNFNKQTWSQDCVINFKYKKAYQQNSERLDTELTFIGEWTRTDRYPTEDDYEESILEIGDYWIIGEDITISPPPESPNSEETFKTGEFIICESFSGGDPVWVKGEIGWYTARVRGKEVSYPIFSPVLNETTGDIKEFNGSVTIPAGTRDYVQHHFNSDFIYELYDVTCSDDTQHIKIYALADNGMRLLYGFNTEYLRNIVEYLHRRYIPALDECPTCDGTGLENGLTCSECDGYKYIANPNSDYPPDIDYDYITDALAQTKKYRKQTESNEAYRWKVWAKYWWKVPITERIKEYVGHFLRIDPESINIVKPTENDDGVIPQCIWRLEIELNLAGSIIDVVNTDANIKQLVYNITPAGTKVLVVRLIGYTDGDYDTYKDNYWSDSTTEVITPNQLNVGCVAPDVGQDILSGKKVKTHFEDTVFSSGMERTIGTYDLAASSGTSLIIDETLSNVNDCSGTVYIEGTRYDFTDYDSSTQTFTLTSSLGSHTDNVEVEIFYNTAERTTNSNYTDFYNNVDQTDYIKYIEMDVPISIVDSSNTVRKWDDKI